MLSSFGGDLGPEDFERLVLEVARRIAVELGIPSADAEELALSAIGSIELDHGQVVLRRLDGSEAARVSRAVLEPLEIGEEAE